MRFSVIGILLLASGLLAADQPSDMMEPSGRWCARADSMAHDGYFEWCVLILTEKRESGPPETQAFAWEGGACTKGRKYCGVSWTQWHVASGPTKLRPIPGGFAFDDPKNTIVPFPAGVAPQIRFATRNGKVALEGGEYSADAPLVWERFEEFGDFPPSFPCAKAHQPRELAICQSPSLSFLDQQLSLTFERVMRCAHMAKKPLRTEDEIKQSQSEWWKDKLSACHDGACVEPLYRARMAELNGMCVDN